VAARDEAQPVSAQEARDRELLNLRRGSRVVIDGEEWEVTLLLPYLGRLRIRPAAAGRGAEREVTIQSLIRNPDCWPSTSTADLPSSSRGLQPATLEDITDAQRAVVAVRYAHVMEAETGFRSGDPDRALPGEPRPGYDPDAANLTQRREAKAAELAALPTEEAAVLGLAHVSVRTLKRWGSLAKENRIEGLISGSWVRRSPGRLSVTPEVREAIFDVREQCLRQSRTDMRTKHTLMRKYMADTFGPDAAVPSYSTMRRVWLEWFGPSGARMKYQRSAETLRKAQGKHPGGHIVVSRPGQVVALDTTEAAVMVRDGVFGDPVPMHLTLALDVYTHSIVAFRLTLVSDTSADVAMLLRDVIMPLPMRDGWREDMEWPYPGVPASVVAEFAGHRVAGLPFFAPETVTTDHGSVYKIL
jgi:hypothetical protein